MQKKTLNENDILQIIKKITFKTVGCTEPIAIALAAAVAYKEIGGKVKSAKIYLDKNVYKNAAAVGIPGTDQKGPKMAVALGLIDGNPSKGLLLLEDVSASAISQAKALLANGAISVDVDETATGLHIQAEIETENGFAKAIIDQCHDNVILIEKNGEIIYRRIADTENDTCFLGEYDFSKLDVKKLIHVIENISTEELSFLRDGFIANKCAAEEGIAHRAGLGLGATYKQLIEDGTLDNNFINQTKMLVAGAVDARMGGLKVPILGCTGSGNHGIAFFLTTTLCFQHFQVVEQRQLHASALGLVLLAVIKQNLGLLSSVCGGAIAVGAAMAAAIVYALGGNLQQINNAINLIIANISGIVCDGAKASCSLKIVTGAALAIEAALLAMKCVCVSATDGLVGDTLQQTIANLALLNKCGMQQVEDTVLTMLRDKK